MNKLTKKIVSIFLAAAMAVLMVGTPASAATAEELQAQIASLLAMIQSLQAQLASAGGSTGSTGVSYNFTRDLTVGSTGDDVKALQQYLNANGAQVAASGAGSPGNESMYFGTLTKSALSKWQAANSVSPASGYFGPITRSKLVSLGGVVVGGGTGTVVLPGSSYLTVMADGPSVATIPDGSIYNSLLRLKFTAGNTEQRVTGVTVTRGGYISNTYITGVSVWDEMGNRYGNIITALTADGKATVSFTGNPFVIPAGQTKTLILAANLSADTGSATVSYSVNSASDISVAAGSMAPSGTFPLMGNVMTIVDGANSLGNVYIDDQSVAGGAWATVTTDSGNVEIGDLQREVFKLRLVQNNSKEAVRLEKLVVFVEGTLREATDIKNWKLYSPQGDVLATAENPYDRYVTFNLATPYVVDKGLTKDFSIKADILDGSGYYFRVYIQNDYDLVVRGATTGAAVLPLDGDGAALTGSDTQNANGAFKMKAGALTVAKSASSPSGNVAPAAQNIVLAKFDIKSTGEQLEIRKMGIQVLYSAVAHDLTGTIVVRDAATSETYMSLSADTANLQVTSAPTANSLLTYQRDLSSYLTLASGETKTIEVVGTIDANATSSSNYTVYAGQFYTKRISTNDYTNLAAAAYQSNQLSVESVTLGVTKSASFGNVNRAAGATNVKIAEFVLQPSAADDIRINSITFDVATSSYIQNMKLMMGGEQLGSDIGSPSATGNTFTVNRNLTKSSTNILEVYANILSTASTTTGFGTIIVSVNDSGISGYGVNSGTSLSTTPDGDLAGQTIQVQSGSLTVSRDASAPISKIVLAGSQGIELNKIKFEAASEDLTLRKITLSMTTASSTQWAAATAIAANINKIYLYDGATLLNAGGTSLASGDAVISGLNVTLVQGTPKTLTVKADINASDTITPKSVGGIKVKSSSTSDMEVYSSQGLMSSSITLAGTGSDSNNFLFTAAAPSIANTYTGGTSKLGDANDEVARFTITNSGVREITLASTTVTANMSITGSATSGVSNFRLFELSDLSNAVATTTSYIRGSTAASSTATFSFGVLAALSPTQTIAAGASKTYVIKADTTAIEDSVANSNTVSTYLTLKLVGTNGYSSSDAASSPSGEELYWNDGVVSYSYTAGANNGTTYSNLNASDSGEVSGPTLVY